MTRVAVGRRDGIVVGQLCRTEDQREIHEEKILAIIQGTLLEAELGSGYGTDQSHI